MFIVTSLARGHGAARRGLVEEDHGGGDGLTGAEDAALDRARREGADGRAVLGPARLHDFGFGGAMAWRSVAVPRAKA
jgi:hypothetical protein